MDLKKMNVLEMNSEELRETEGGWLIPALVVAAVVIIAVGAYNGYKDTEQAGKK